MRILIVSTQLPFVSGGAELLEANLKNALIENGHEAEIVNIVFNAGNQQKIPEQILATRMLDVTQSAGEDIDRVICLKFPAYYVKHKNRIVWLVHQHRWAYELWGTNYNSIKQNESGNKLREIIKTADNNFLLESKKIFTISKNVSSRLKKYNTLESTPLYPPLNDTEQFYQSSFDDYVFLPSRFSKLKRQDLAIEAMKFVKTNARLVLAGRPDNKHELDKIKNLISDLKLEDRISVLVDISHQKKLDLFSNSLGTIFIPYDEDYGFVTLESFYSKKPVITTDDSGCPIEFVDHQKNGYISSTSPNEIASYIDKLFLDKKNAEIMGQNGFKKINSMDLSWNHVVKELTS